MVVFDITQQLFVDQTFKEIDFSKKDIDSKEFETCKFINCNLSEANLHKTKFYECDFENSNLSLAKIKNTHFSNTTFNNCKMIGINWTQAYWPKIKLHSPIEFFNCSINHSVFLGLSLAEIQIVNCIAHNVDFREADLTNANCSGSDFAETMFIHTVLTKSNFSHAINYNIDVFSNKIKGAKFTLPDAINLLETMGIELVEN